MIKTESFDVYKMYLGIRLHFKDGNYNYVKNEGRIKASNTSFEKRPDKYFFEKLARKYNEEELLDYFLANSIYGTENKVIYNQDEAENIYNIWRSKKEGMSYVIMEDISLILDSDIEFNHHFVVSNGEHPILLTMFLQDKILMETIIVLNELIDFLEDWRNYIDDEYVWPDIYKKMVRYSDFITIDIPKYKDKIKEIL
jgi:hypothetical protein